MFRDARFITLLNEIVSYHHVRMYTPTQLKFIQQLTIRYSAVSKHTLVQPGGGLTQDFFWVGKCRWKCINRLSKEIWTDFVTL